MRNKGLIAIFTLLALVLSISTIWLVTNIKKVPVNNEKVLGTATGDDLKVTSSIDYIKNNTDGSTEIKYVYTLSNTSDLYYIISLTAKTSLQDTFSPYSFQILALTSDGLTVNPSFNGSSNTDLLATGNHLLLGESRHIYLTVKFFPNGSTGPFNNRVTADGDIVLPPTGSTTTSTTGGSTGTGSTTSTPPSTTTTTTTTTTGGSSGTSTGTTGGTTIGTEPPVPPVSGPETTTTTGGSTTGGTGSTTLGSTTGGTTGATTGGTTTGGDPDTIAAAQVSFTLTASGGGGTITQIQLPNTSILPFHFGLLSNISEWIKDNILHEQRNKIEINNIAVNGEIFEGENENTLNQGFWRLPESSTPSEGGNTVILGHRFTYNYGPYTFYNLDKLALGDSIYIKWKGKDYEYKVTKIRNVEATDISVLDQTQNNILTLITCTSWNTNEPRLVIQAELK